MASATVSNFSVSKKTVFFDKYLKLKRGDIWHSVNGIPLSLETGLGAFEKIKNDNHFEVAVTRHEQDIKNMYEVIP